jgi:hypothetical protein
MAGTTCEQAFLVLHRPGLCIHLGQIPAAAHYFAIGRNFRGNAECRQNGSKNVRIKEIRKKAIAFRLNLSDA